MKPVSFRYTIEWQYNACLALFFCLYAAPVALLSRLLPYGPWGLRGGPLTVALLGIALLAVALLLALAAHFTARRVCDKTGYAIFHEKGVGIQRGKVLFVHFYGDIQIAEGQEGHGQVFGPLVASYTLTAPGQTLVLGASVRESWQAFGGWRQAWAKRMQAPPTRLAAVMDELGQRCRAADAQKAVG